MFKPIRHVCFIVEKDQVQSPAVWTEYLVGGHRKEKLTVLRSERLLIPRTGMSYGIEVEAYGVGADRAAQWLEEHAYRVVSTTNLAGES
jgi:hypothetical protein